MAPGPPQAGHLRNSTLLRPVACAVLLVAAGLAGIDAAASISQAGATACTPAGQRIDLLLLYNTTNGPQWSNSSGWPIDWTSQLQSLTPGDLMERMASSPLSTGTCMVANASGSSGLMQPDHCCWYGISCCGPATCQNDRYCNCTPGLITEIRLRNNQVRAEDGQQ